MLSVCVFLNLAEQWYYVFLYTSLCLCFKSVSYQFQKEFTKWGFLFLFAIIYNPPTPCRFILSIYQHNHIFSGTTSYKSVFFSPASPTAGKNTFIVASNLGAIKLWRVPSNRDSFNENLSQKKPMYVSIRCLFTCRLSAKCSTSQNPMLLNILYSHLSVQDPAQRLQLRKVNYLLLTQNKLFFAPLTSIVCVKMCKIVRSVHLSIISLWGHKGTILSCRSSCMALCF